MSFNIKEPTTLDIENQPRADTESVSGGSGSVTYNNAFTADPVLVTDKKTLTTLTITGATVTGFTYEYTGGNSTFASNDFIIGAPNDTISSDIFVPADGHPVFAYKLASGNDGYYARSDDDTGLGTWSVSVISNDFNTADPGLRLFVGQTNGFVVPLVSHAPTTGAIKNYRTTDVTGATGWSLYGTIFTGTGSTGSFRVSSEPVFPDRNLVGISGKSTQQYAFGGMNAYGGNVTMASGLGRIPKQCEFDVLSQTLGGNPKGVINMVGGVGEQLFVRQYPSGSNGAIIGGQLMVAPNVVTIWKTTVFVGCCSGKDKTFHFNSPGSGTFIFDATYDLTPMTWFIPEQDSKNNFAFGKPCIIVRKDEPVLQLTVSEDED